VALWHLKYKGKTLAFPHHITLFCTDTVHAREILNPLHLVFYIMGTTPSQNICFSVILNKMSPKILVFLVHKVSVHCVPVRYNTPVSLGYDDELQPLVGLQFRSSVVFRGTGIF